MDTYSEDFKIAIEVLMSPQIEGGYSNHPADSGGATNMGITEMSFNAYVKKTGKNWSFRTMTKPQGKEFYFDEYWVPLRLYEFPSQALKNAVLATAVNMGKVPAISKLQHLLDVPRDGIVGPVTLEKMNKVFMAEGEKAIVNSFCREIEEFYVALAKERPKDQVFLKGWKKRINSFRIA